MPRELVNILVNIILYYHDIINGQTWSWDSDTEHGAAAAILTLPFAFPLMKPSITCTYEYVHLIVLIYTLISTPCRVGVEVRCEYNEIYNSSDVQGRFDETRNYMGYRSMSKLISKYVMLYKYA